MISLDKIQACSNPRCRLLLPADPENPTDAGFGVVRRVEGRVVKFSGRCRGCVAERRRRTRGTTRRNNSVYGGYRDGRQVKLKVCRVCDEEKVCEDGPGSEFRIQQRRPGYSVVWNPICKVCQNRIHKERMETDVEYAERVREAGRRNHLRWIEDPKNREKARAAALKHYEKLKREDPERLREYVRRHYEKLKREDPERRREYARMSYVLRREREGKKVHHRKTVIDGTLPRVLAEPFRKYLVAYSAATGISSYEELGSALGIEPKRVGGVWGGRRKVALDVVDRAIQNARIVVRVDGRDVIKINDLYPT